MPTKHPRRPVAKPPQGPAKPPQGRRLTIDVSEATAAQIDRMQALTGASTSTLVRTAINTLAEVIEGVAKGNHTPFVPLPFAVGRQVYTQMEIKP